METPHAYSTVESEGKTWLVLQDPDLGAPPPPPKRTRLYSCQEYMVGHAKIFAGFAASPTWSALQGTPQHLPPDEVRIEEEELDGVSGAASPRASALCAPCGPVDQDQDVCDLTADLEKVADEAEPHDIDEIDGLREKYAHVCARYVAPKRAKRASPPLRVNQGTAWDCALCPAKVNGQADARHHIENKHLPGRYRVDAVLYRQKKKAERHTRRVPEDMMENGDNWRSFYLKSYEILWGRCFPGKIDGSGRMTVLVELALVDGISRRDVNRLCYALLERYREIHRLSVTHDVSPRRHYGVTIDISQLHDDHSASTDFVDDLSACGPCLCRLDELENSMDAQTVHFYRDQRPLAEVANDSANETVASRAFFSPETTSRNMTQYLDCAEPADSEGLEEASLAPVNRSIPNERGACAATSEDVQPAPVRQESEVEDLQLIEVAPPLDRPEQIVSESIVKPNTPNSSAFAEAPVHCASLSAQLLELHPVAEISLNTIPDQTSFEVPNVVKAEAISIEDFTEEPVERDPQFYNVSLKRSWSSSVGFASQMENLLDRSPALDSEFPEMALLLHHRSSSCIEASFENHDVPGQDLDANKENREVENAPIAEHANILESPPMDLEEAITAAERGEIPDLEGISDVSEDLCDYIDAYGSFNTGAPATNEDEAPTTLAVRKQKLLLLRCSSCATAFNSLTRIVEHLLSKHCGRLPYPYRCRSCSHACAHKYNLVSHMRRRHRLQKPVAWCKERIVERWHPDTLRELNNQAGINFPKCQKSRKNFLSVGQVVLHLLAAHCDGNEAKIWRCRRCDFNTNYESCIATHLARMHRCTQKWAIRKNSCQLWHPDTMRRLKDVAPLYFPGIEKRVERYLVDKIKRGLLDVGTFSNNPLPPAPTNTPLQHLPTADHTRLDRPVARQAVTRSTTPDKRRCWRFRVFKTKRRKNNSPHATQPSWYAKPEKGKAGDGTGAEAV
ncbi:unnamed protein product, partial [Mesorhabditis spiculigera]